MHKITHIKLSILFTIISSMIMITMSVLYFQLFKKQLENSHFSSFTQEMNTYVASFNEKFIFTLQDKSRLQQDYKTVLLDNGTPLLHFSADLSKTEQDILEEIILLHTDELYDCMQYTEGFFVHKEYILKKKDSIFFSSYAMINHSPGILSACIIYQDTSIQKQMRHTLCYLILINILGVICLFLFSLFYTTKLLKPIDDSINAQNAFISAASHELRTPLAVILSALSAYKIAPQNEKEKFVDIIENEATQMSRLVSDMLSLARSDTHSWKLEFSKVELDTLLLNSFEAFTPITKEHKMKLFLNLPEVSIPPCCCDAQRITQVLAILISNAISYCNEGAEIKLSLQYSHHNFLISVADNGNGISDEDKIKIFDRFYRSDSSRSQKDHFGLGLSVAKEIITLHHGIISVSDTPNGGATFTINLP